MFESNAGAKIFGGWSRGFEQKSFSLFARGEYGVKTFEYPFFQSRPYSTYGMPVYPFVTSIQKFFKDDGSWFLSLTFLLNSCSSRRRIFRMIFSSTAYTSLSPSLIIVSLLLIRFQRPSSSSFMLNMVLFLSLTSKPLKSKYSFRCANPLAWLSSLWFCSLILKSI